MKNVLKVFLGVICFLLCVVIGLFVSHMEGSDSNHAYVEVTTSTGAVIYASENGDKAIISGLEMALKNPVAIEAEESEVIKFHFVCDECGYDETVELTAPAAKVFECSCPEEADDSDHTSVKEYVAVIISLKE